MLQKYVLQIIAATMIAPILAGCSQTGGIVSEVTNSDMLAYKEGMDVKAGEVAYYGDVKGYLARPDDDKKYPGVVMIHEWWGLNDNIRQMARELASQGYTVLAVDLYNGEVATTQERAQQLTSSINQEEATQNIRAAIEYLREKEGVERVASLGWCFGGGQSMIVALSGEKLDATVIYYGNLVTDKAELRKISWPVLGIFGSKDNSIPVDTVRQFKNNLNIIGVKNEIYVYNGAGHAFANPSGMNYAAEESKDAWEKTLAFLDKHLKS